MTTPRITIFTDFEGVHVAFETYYPDGNVERVIAHGRSQTEAIENLVLRFKFMQNAALEALVEHGFIVTQQSQARQAGLS